MRFSIVIPTFNYGHLVERAVRSACGQSGDDYEVIVVDDGSTDNTAEVLAALNSEFSHLHIVSQDNSGASAARNRGVREARGRLVLFLDADDELLENALADFRLADETAGEPDMIVARTLSVFLSGDVRISPVPEISEDPEQRFLDYLYKKIRLSNGAVAMSRSLLERFRFNERLRQTEDIPVFAHCLVNGRCAVSASQVVKIYKHDDSRRHGADAALSVGMQLVDEVFSPGKLPDALMKHRGRYEARRGVSLFRLLYRRKRYAEARIFYRKALKNDWREALRKPENLVKFLHACLA
ncbi:MAG: glycosyl transferase family A [Spongiibacteraceae bacterium]|nr:glycosyl transferase family A [Spongiibacteraceae bacterium]